MQSSNVYHSQRKIPTNWATIVDSCNVSLRWRKSFFDQTKNVFSLFMTVFWPNGFFGFFFSVLPVSVCVSSVFLFPEHLLTSRSVQLSSVLRSAHNLYGRLAGRLALMWPTDQISETGKPKKHTNCLGEFPILWSDCLTACQSVCLPKNTLWHHRLVCTTLVCLLVKYLPLPHDITLDYSRQTLEQIAVFLVVVAVVVVVVDAVVGCIT